MRVCAFLAPDAIPEELLTEGASHLGDTLAPVAADPLLFNQVIESVRAYSLVDRSRETSTLSVHRLVQAVLEDSMDESTRTLWAERAVRAVNEAFPSGKYETWPQCKRLLPQALACADLIEQRQMIFPQSASLLIRTGSYLSEQARYQEAEQLIQQALAIREQQLGSEHPDTIRSRHWLAFLYKRQGKYQQAEPLYQHVLSIYERELGPEHPDTATSLNNLAALYLAQSKYEQAEPLLQRALAMRKKLLGPEHPHTAVSLNDLALLYKNQGKYEQAEPLYRQALAIYEQRLGPEHPHTRTIRSNYASLLRDMGKGPQ